MSRFPAFRRILRAWALAALLSSVAASAALPPETLPLTSLDAFRPAGPNWQLAGELGGDPRVERTLEPQAGAGMLVCTPGTERPARTHLLTDWEHADLELELQFLLPPGSNSGVYFMGRYEVQLFDSWGVRAPTFQDCGAIYARHDAARGAGRESFDGHPPLANAARAPGLWQTLRVEFEAPRFDAAGRKVRNARFARVELNGFVVQENVEISGPTRSAAFSDEQPQGPLMLQGDHGPVAFRRITVKRFGPETITAENLRFQLYRGDFKQVGVYEAATPPAEGTPERFAHDAVEKSGKFALVFTGDLVVPHAGRYEFAIESGSTARLQINGTTVVSPLDRGSVPGEIELPAGRHAFRTDLVHTTNSRPSFELVAEGPGVRPHAITVREQPTRAAKPPPVIPVSVGERTEVIRGFVPFEPRKRLYAISVGTPSGLHFAYDFETAGLLRAWRGEFLDAAPMWEGRGHDQLARPRGPALEFPAQPNLVLIEYPQRQHWPETPDALWSSRGYLLEADGQPVFLGRLADLTMRDRFAPLADGKGLQRTVQLEGRLPSWSVWLLVAEADEISPQPAGRGWIVGEREFYVDWPADATLRPILRRHGERTQLALPVSAATLGQSVRYTLVW